MNTQTNPAHGLPDISRTELEAVSIHLNSVIHAVNASPEAHRMGHVAVLCHSLLTRLVPSERGAAIAYLNHMIRSDLH